MSIVTTTMPGQVNPDIGVQVYPLDTTLSFNTEIVASTIDNVGNSYHVARTDEKHTLYVQKIGPDGKQDPTWGGKLQFDKSFVIFQQDDTDPFLPLNYAWKNISLDKMSPQSITIDSEKIFIVGNTTYDTDNAIPIGGQTLPPLDNEYPPVVGYPASVPDYITNVNRGFLLALNFSTGVIDNAYYDLAYDGSLNSVPNPTPIQAINPERCYFASSATLWTQRNKDQQDSAKWNQGNMPPSQSSDSLHIYVTPSNQGAFNEKLLDPYVNNIEGSPLQTNMFFNDSIGGGDNDTLFVGNEDASNNNTSIVVRGYQRGKLQGKQTFASDGPNGVLVLDPSGNAAHTRLSGSGYKGSGNTIAYSFGNTTLVPTNQGFVIGGQFNITDLGSGNVSMGALCVFDQSGIVQSSYTPIVSPDASINYIDITGKAVEVTNIITDTIPPVLGSSGTINTLRLDGGTASESCSLTKMNKNGVIDITFGTAGFFEPVLPGYNIVLSKTDLSLNNTSDIAIYNNDYYISLTALEGGDQAKATGLVVKLDMDGDTVADFGTNGYAQFNKNTVKGDKTNQIITQTIWIPGYVSQAQTLIGWAFGASSASPFVPLGIPFNLLTYSSSICFPAGTPINTDQGIKNIENISTKKHTINGNKINAITKTIMKKLNYLVVLEQGCIGDNIPSKQTICSPNHKILYRGRMIEANLLLDKKVEGVYSKNYDNSPLYNVLLDSHSTMTVNNMTTETLHPRNPIGMLYNKHIPQTLKEQAIIHYNLKEMETKHICRESFLLKKYVHNPEYAYNQNNVHKHKSSGNRNVGFSFKK